MGRVRFGGCDTANQGASQFPIAFACFWLADKVLIRVRRVALPDAIGAAKVGNPRFGAGPCRSEHDDLVGGFQELHDVLDSLLDSCPSWFRCHQISLPSKTDPPGKCR